MYNRYIPNGTSYTRVTESEQDPSSAHKSEQADSAGALSQLLKSLKLEKIDHGDILLLLILLLLFLDGDDLEMMIALGLILILGIF